jgi:hypothetical protein
MNRMIKSVCEFHRGLKLEDKCQFNKAIELAL